MSKILYSTNSFAKHLIQSTYRDNKHYIWCSEHFDGTAAPRYSAPSLVAQSSNPVDIYRELKKATERGGDRHNEKINQQRLLYNKLAIDWANNGEITDLIKNEIIFIANNQSLEQWRPLLYVIPITDEIKSRLKSVPIEQRASVAMEYIIEDLDASEFDIVEL